ncbi:asparagine synthase C-terminal domain-containing protein, partial [uncultured Gemmiger sp.]|uniref:asparagine synthase C-terminal domain-containing protein n=1 Tax=uncultured Gemmiger sp. TaxID=1623490 RepID=UPI0025F0266F
QLQWVDMHTWMLYDILLKADRMSMANSLELRVPFLDRKVLELALSIPQKYRSGKEETKIALRGAALKQLPDSVAKRKKLGFPVPLNDWLRQDKYAAMVREKFTGEVAEKFFDTAALCRLLDDHVAGRAKNMTKIWSFYSFILWYELYFVQAAPPAEVYAR